jgi:hypothetical protein
MTLKDRFFDFYAKIDKNQEALFFIKNISGKFEVPTESMSGDILSERLIELSRGGSVLEFGSGGSTIVFARHCNTLISVESDFFFARKLKKITKGFSNTEILWANIGPTRSFGNPIRFSKRIFRSKWISYAQRPWACQNRNIDLVFIDGRFRVSSAMQCYLNIESKFILVFDDYFSRAEYHFVELFLGKPREKIGDSALFEIPNHSQREQVNSGTWQKYEKYVYDFR